MSGLYPDTKLLKRERKVVGRAQKEKIRNGTKYQTVTKSKVHMADVSAVVIRINCGDSEDIV